MRLRLLAVVLLMPACGSILGVEQLDVREQEIADAGPKKDAAGPVTDSGSSSGTVETDSGDATSPPPPATLPPDGTYNYAATTGDGDAITVDGAAFPKSGYSTPTIEIAHDPIHPGCFEETIVLRGNYNDTLTACIVGSTIVVTNEHRTQSFQFGSADTTATCAGDVYYTTQPKAGDQWLHDCNGSNTASKSSTNDSSSFEQKGEYVYKETTTVPVGNANVAVDHYHVELAITGSQTGTNTADWYLAKTSGIPVKLERSIHINYSSQFGPVTYNETVGMTITTPPP